MGSPLFFPAGFFILAMIALLVDADTLAGQSADAGHDIAHDVQQVRENFLRSIVPTEQSEIDQLNLLAQRDASALGPDGTWPDIDYADKTRSTWKTHDHLARTLLMAQSAFIRRESGQIDLELEARILAALQTWIDRDFQNSNWWWNEIAVPRSLGRIGCLIGDRLPDALRQKIVQIMRRSQWQKWTGANLVWGVANQVMRGLLQDDPQTISQAFDRLYAEIRVVRQQQEGIQTDGSFHQHGAQLYNGGYGLDFSVDAGSLISFASGTRFEIPADRMAVFTNFLLDGQQWMIRADVFDFSAVGREITRKGKLAVPRVAHGVPGQGEASLANVVSRLAEMPSPRQTELRAFAARLAGVADAPELVGNRQFWCSDFMTHRRREYFASVKMLSSRMQNGEIVNGEGMLSQHLSDGANFLYLSGQEYQDIFPAWDWTHVPGTTAIADALLPNDSNSVTARGGSDFAGGVSDGTYGLCAMQLARGSLSAHKAWFFFDDAYLCLGAGITLAANADADVITDVNQTLLAMEVVTDSQKLSQTSAVEERPISWVNHNHVGYVFAPGTPVHLWAGTRTGRWSDIGTGSDTPVTLGVFDLWIDHGRRCHDGQYQFIVLPGASATQTAQRAKQSGIDVLANTPDIQAAYTPSLKLLGIVFSKPGSLQTPIGRVEADFPCLLLIRNTPQGIKITASSPRNQTAALTVTIAGRPTSLDLPSGDDAGRSVSQLCR